MEGCSKQGDQACPQLLDLIHKERREWFAMRDGERSSSLEEKKLELKLGPPGGGEDSCCSLKDSTNNNREKDHHHHHHHHHHSLLSLGYFSSMNNNNNNKGFSFIHQQSPPSLPVMANESSQPCCTKVVDLQSVAEMKAFSSPATAKNTAVHNSSHKRTAPAPVVGWPPIRSFRKNLASTSASTKPASDSPNGIPNEATINEKPAHDPTRKSLFVKINMDGVPIGRKVDLNAFDSYEKLSTAVDELFRGLLAAQRDSSASGIADKQEKEKEKAITGVMDGSGEYTLVYEDNEGDRMLVGDVPWHMFVSTVKRLRVLKSSEVSALSYGSSKKDKILA